MVNFSELGKPKEDQKPSLTDEVCEQMGDFRLESTVESGALLGQLAVSGADLREINTDAQGANEQ